MKYGELILCRQVLKMFELSFLMISIWQPWDLRTMNQYATSVLDLTSLGACHIASEWAVVRRRRTIICHVHGFDALLLLSSQDHNWSWSVQDFSITTGKYSYSRSQWPRRPRRGSVAPRLLGFRFESCRKHGYLPPGSAVCCQVEIPASGCSLVQRSRTECGASERHRGVCVLRRPRITRICCAIEKRHTYTNWYFEGK